VGEEGKKDHNISFLETQVKIVSNKAGSSGLIWVWGVGDNHPRTCDKIRLRMALCSRLDLINNQLQWCLHLLSYLEILLEVVS
jgi:hypothetical protein